MVYPEMFPEVYEIRRNHLDDVLGQNPARNPRLKNHTCNQKKRQSWPFIGYNWSFQWDYTFYTCFVCLLYPLVMAIDTVNFP